MTAAATPGGAPRRGAVRDTPVGFRGTAALMVGNYG